MNLIVFTSFITLGVSSHASEEMLSACVSGACASWMLLTMSKTVTALVHYYSVLALVSGMQLEVSTAVV